MPRFCCMTSSQIYHLYYYCKQHLFDIAPTKTCRLHAFHMFINCCTATALLFCFSEITQQSCETVVWGTVDPRISDPSHIRPLAYPTFRIKQKWSQIHLLRKLRDLMQGKIYKIVKILGRMNSRTVMMERFQDARVLMTLLSTEDSNDSQKGMRAVLTIHPTLAYPFFSLIRPLFLRVLSKGGRICEGLLYWLRKFASAGGHTVLEVSVAPAWFYRICTREIAGINIPA